MPRDRGFRRLRTLRLPNVSAQLYSRHLLLENENAFTSRLPNLGDELKDFARHSEWRHLEKSALSANHGLTITVKDNIVTKQLPTTCASNILTAYMAPQSATVIRLLEDAGMLVIGKTNMDEFGMGSHSLNSAFSIVKNGPKDKAISVGGSSGGSAYAVAASLSPVALGTDTGGSVRLPAAYLNMIGFKPSYGRISRNGVIPYANSLDTVGIIGKSCRDIFLTFQLIDEHDELDPTSLDAASRKRIQQVKNERQTKFTGSLIHTVALNGQKFKYFRRARQQRLTIGQSQPCRRIGVPTEYNIEEMHPIVRRAWAITLSTLEANGHEIVPISLPSTKQALSAYYVIAPAEASSNLAKYDGVRYGVPRSKSPDDADGTLYSAYRGKNFGAEVKRRILLGTFTLSASAMDNYFIQAQKVRRLVQDDFNKAFKMRHPLLKGSKSAADGVDYIICPTAPTPPPLIKSVVEAGPLESYTNDVFTVPASLAGLPAISVPSFHDPDLPRRAELAIGMQIIGQYGDDFSVLKFAQEEFEDRQDWNGMLWRKQSQRMA